MLFYCASRSETRNLCATARPCGCQRFVASVPTLPCFSSVVKMTFVSCTATRLTCPISKSAIPSCGRRLLLILLLSFINHTMTYSTTGTVIVGCGSFIQLDLFLFYFFLNLQLCVFATLLDGEGGRPKNATWSCRTKPEPSPAIWINHTTRPGPLATFPFPFLFLKHEELVVPLLRTRKKNARRVQKVSR